MSDFVQPKLWASDQLDADIATAIEAFRNGRFEESVEVYPNIFDKAQDSVDTLLEQTVDLSMLVEAAGDILNDPALIDALRHLAGPPISNDDLLILLDIKKSAFKLNDPALIAKVIDTVRATLDKRRFPWVLEEREPTAQERHAAVLASAALMANTRMGTWRRVQAKINQENAVKQALSDKGFKAVTVKGKKIRTIREAPEVGHFCGEVHLGSRQADIVVSLWDGRIMPIECKVSSSSINSYKRLNNDAAVKAKTWTKEFGNFVVPSAVIAGVFKRANVESAQNDGLMVLWAHRLTDLTDFIDQTRPTKK